ncbi:hypothetical protein SRS16CHR_05474 [Variovorax sp. SRS16]|uniref:hypothetical protein n=1 Tax=Variovorax sp. SRS16 TaxID=282217 RepID=UPI0013167047|nr:hypothetical protein [Variovorax sp. SRS16]VTU34368.1 hypothetical protein SRS16CHR_05474 [Variovorax sp. SRS16]
MSSIRSARRARRATCLCALAALAGSGLLASTPALADPSPALDRFSFSVGAYGADPTINATVLTPYGALNSGDIQRGRVTMPRISADLLIGDSQGLSLDYFQYSRGYTGALASNFAIGPGTVTTIGNANVDFKLDFGQLAYRWWIGSGNTVLGLGAGAAYYKATLRTNAVAGLNGLTAAFSQQDSDDAIAPLLEVGVRHAITPDLRLFADASGIRKFGGKFSGNIYNAALGVEWFPLKNVGVVASYNLTNIDLQRDGYLAERLRVRLHGPTVALKARF